MKQKTNKKISPRRKVLLALLAVWVVVISVTIVANASVATVPSKCECAEEDCGISEVKNYGDYLYYEMYCGGYQVGSIVHCPGYEEAIGNGCSFADLYDDRVELFDMDGEVVELSCQSVDDFPESITAPTTPNGIAQTVTKDVTSAIGVFLKGIGSTLTNFFDNVVLTTNAEGQRILSTFAGWTIAFVGIGFGAGLLRKLLKKAN